MTRRTKILWGLAIAWSLCLVGMVVFYWAEPKPPFSLTYFMGIFFGAISAHYCWIVYSETRGWWDD